LIYDDKKFFKEWNISPALLFVWLGKRIGSDARSGCGIRPMTLPFLLHIAAIISVEPFGF
jgi:hypothetical protein